MVDYITKVGLIEEALEDENSLLIPEELWNRIEDRREYLFEDKNTCCWGYRVNIEKPDNVLLNEGSLLIEESSFVEVSPKELIDYLKEGYNEPCQIHNESWAKCCGSSQLDSLMKYIFEKN